MQQPDSIGDRMCNGKVCEVDPILKAENFSKWFIEKQRFT
jgi:hypothetical protein